MKQDEIIEMARQAGIYHAQDSEYHWDGLTDQKIIERTPDSAKDIAWRNRRTFEILKPFAKLVAEKSIKKALAQPEQEPVATLWQHGETGRTRITMPNDITDCDARWFKAADLYTTPPQRKPLTDEEIEDLYFDKFSMGDLKGFARAIEAAHGIWPENSDCYGPDWTDRDGEYLK